MVKLLIKTIRLYQEYISILFGRRCRFYPTCSQYAVETLEKYGLIIGSFKAIIRLAKCHPFHPGGYDPA